MKLTIRVRKSLSESKCIVFLSASYNVDLKLCMVIGLTGQLSEDIIIIIFNIIIIFTIIIITTTTICLWLSRDVFCFDDSHWFESDGCFTVILILTHVG